MGGDKLLKEMMTDYPGLLAYSDWLRDEGREEEAIAFLDAITEERGWSSGNVDRSGDGNGYGYGRPTNNGEGCGTGSRNGNGSGAGDGWGDDDGDGGGDGFSHGYN